MLNQAQCNILSINIKNDEPYKKYGIFQINCDGYEQMQIGQTIGINQGYKNHF